jgi:hypothetical protein
VVLTSCHLSRSDGCCKLRVSSLLALSSSLHILFNKQFNLLREQLYMLLD